MLGRSSTAVITFDGPHVPYYITYQSGDYCCKPYHKSVQYCRKCGAIGHRQDICPRPRETFCYTCGQDVVSEAHDCLPKCKICEQAHETAGKECKKKLRPSPPPYQVRQQQLIKSVLGIQAATNFPSSTTRLPPRAAHRKASLAQAAQSCDRGPGLAQDPGRALAHVLSSE
ncbi:hypothetical protein HPB50_021876 [Hyalomma asiaticum]|uniref:Uncharacterized protein n=1 Tax=Hyalomma asiaticum TaxID=266040 RepID=A0ACB7T145_HYAAI|nr:hypothetical protein HPB50_021876 [Hyalomma asiaticum]